MSTHAPTRDFRIMANIKIACDAVKYSSQYRQEDCNARYGGQICNAFHGSYALDGPGPLTAGLSHTLAPHTVSDA